MWISGYITGNSFRASAPSVGEVSSSGNRVSVSSTAEHRAIDTAAPGGIAYVPRLGDSSVVLPTESGDVCIGVIAPLPQPLEPGELMLYSAGGASIVLKNDGRVLINGRAVE